MMGGLQRMTPLRLGGILRSALGAVVAVVVWVIGCPSWCGGERAGALPMSHRRSDLRACSASRTRVCRCGALTLESAACAESQAISPRGAWLFRQSGPLSHSTSPPVDEGTCNWYARCQTQTSVAAL
jgi:hypothetical protein